MARIVATDEAIFKRIISFISHSTGIASLQEVPGIAVVLVFIIQHRKWKLHA
jgi:hypothetical protein